MNSASAYNLRHITWYYLLNSLAIAVSASGVITDMLLLKMDFDLAKFGIIKSQIYFLPAVSYLLAAPLLQKLNRDVEVCAWSYLLRCVFPILLPVMALLCSDKTVLLWGTAGVFALGYSCATFANNTLLKVMRGAFPVQKFNRYAMFLTSLLSIPMALLCIFVSSLLARFGGDTRHFMLLLGGIQFLTLLFEFPAIRHLRKVRPVTVVTRHELHWRELKRSMIRSGGLQLFTLCHGLWLGLLSTYFVVYLLQVIRLKGAWILWIELGLAIVSCAAAPWFGKLADRIGYPRTFTVIMLAIAAVYGLWTVKPESPALLILLVVLIYNGNNGILSNLLRQAEPVAAVKLAEAGTEEYLIGINSFLVMLGAFFGCLLAGKVFLAAGQDLVTYFRCCSTGAVVLLCLAGCWRYMEKIIAQRKENAK